MDPERPLDEDECSAGEVSASKEPSPEEPGDAASLAQKPGTGPSPDTPEAFPNRFPRDSRASSPFRGPLVEAGLLYAAFWLAAYLPSDPGQAGAALGLAATHFALLVQLLPKVLLLLYLMARAEGLASFGIRLPRLGDLPRALAVAGGALAIVLLPALISGAVKGNLVNPLLSAAVQPKGSPFLVIPLFLASCLTVGYGEELFFRVYLTRRLGQAGLPPVWTLVVSSLLFGSAHGLQGLLGIGLGTVLGFFFAWRWVRGRNFHEIALGHALYDFLAILATLYGAAP